MSRLSSESVLLRFAPDRVCARLQRGWWRPRVVASAQRPVETATGDDDARSAALDDAMARSLEAVLHELHRTTPWAQASLQVEVADSLAHLDVVDGDFAGESQRQLETIALACVSELLGEAAREHEVRWQLLPGGHQLLIGAITRQRLRTLADTARRHRLALRSVQPDFCLQWNRHARTLAGPSAVFAVASGREAVVAQVCDGRIAHISHGAWLDAHPAGTSNVRAHHLMCGLGLEPAVTAGVLDQRVDRLLASAGLRPEQQSAFVLVAPPLSSKAISARWSLVPREATPA